MSDPKPAVNGGVVPFEPMNILFRASLSLSLKIHEAIKRGVEIEEREFNKAVRKLRPREFLATPSCSVYTRANVLKILAEYAAEHLTLDEIAALVKEKGNKRGAPSHKVTVR